MRQASQSGSQPACADHAKSGGSAELNDPETLCADPWNAAHAQRNITLFVDPLFQDAGQRWSSQRGFAKWDPAKLGRCGNVTYTAGAAAAKRSDGLERLTGWVEMPWRAFGAGLYLVGKIVLR